MICHRHKPPEHFDPSCFFNCGKKELDLKICWQLLPPSSAQAFSSWFSCFVIHPLFVCSFVRFLSIWIKLIKADWRATYSLVWVTLTSYFGRRHILLFLLIIDKFCEINLHTNGKIVVKRHFKGFVPETESIKLFWEGNLENQDSPQKVRNVP